MSEHSTIHPEFRPMTADLMADQLAACGLAAGQTVIVHTAMSSIGWIVGGPVDVIRALLHVLGPTGTLMMPTHDSGNTNPARWQHPPVPESWWETIRAARPAYDPAITPTREMGKVAELFRTWPGVIRSAHPIGSFAAIGPNAEHLIANHTSLECMFGDDSPIGRLYALDGHVLLLGVDHENNTSLHLAEYRANFPKTMIPEGTAMMVDGERRWVDFDMHPLDSDDFNRIGDSYEAATGGIQRGQVGRAEVRFMHQRPLVDYAVTWMEENRQ